MSDSTTIHEFPELRALAKEEALRLRSVLWDANPDAAVVSSQKDMARGISTLLRDLSRPASRDAVCRLVAGRIRWTPATVVLAMETTGAIRERLHRDCGVPADAPTSGSATEALAIVVRHLWPEGALDAR